MDRPSSFLATNQLQLVVQPQSQALEHLPLRTIGHLHSAHDGRSAWVWKLTFVAPGHREGVLPIAVVTVALGLAVAVRRCGHWRDRWW